MTVFPRLRQVVRGPSHRWWALGAVQCGNFVVYMDSFIVTLALPAMARQFGCGLHEVKWVLVAYLVSLTVGLLLAGRLADRFGRKAVTIAGMGTMAAGSALCLFAPDLSLLVASRILQGIGGAMVLANVMAEIAGLFPREERRRAMAVNASVLALGQVAGLVAGGWLIETWGWRSIFGIIFVLTLVGLALDIFILRPPPADREKSAIDLPGGFFSLIAVGAPFVIIENLSGWSWDGFHVALLLGCAAAVAGFLLIESRARSPLLALGLFRIRAFTCGSFAALFYFVVATFCYFLVPLYAQVILGLPPLKAGLLMLPLSIALTVASQLSGKVPPQIGARIVATIGISCTTAGVFGLSFLDASSSMLLILALLALVGMGGGIFQPPNNSAVLGRVPPAVLGSANGFFTTARNFGQALGAALAAALLTAGLGPHGAMQALTGGGHLDPSLRELYVHAQQHAFQIGTAFGLVGILLSVFRGPPAPLAPK
ncbi:MAG TPA: MFS transporter [Chthoniobacterales bacterium]|nr:MFS transporter [Chthoniobacterales bacterium]